MRTLLILMLVIGFNQSFSMNVNRDYIRCSENILQCKNPDDSLKREYKLTEAAFIKKYGTNDTSIAIIKLFYEKRKRGITEICLTPFFLAVSYGSIYLAFVLDDAVISNILGGICLSSYICFYASPVIGIVRLSKWNRKDLYYIILDYNKYKIIPLWVKDKLKKK